VAFQRGIDSSEPIRPEPVSDLAGSHEERRNARGHLASGTLACPRCDAPVAPGAGYLTPAGPLGCPYCGHAAAVRDFLSLSEPTRPARVVVRVIRRRLAARR
jgi:hypothetical protein